MRAFCSIKQKIMAKSKTAQSTPKTAPVKPKEIKVEAPKAKPPVKRHSGDHMVRFVSNGLSKFMNKAGKIHNVTADHGQLLVDKGLGVIIEE